MKTYHDNTIVKHLPEDTIFVFGSNRGGRHSKGAALTAQRKFGAAMGCGYGIQGRSFGIPTKDAKLKVLTLYDISNYCSKFIEYAEIHSDVKFFVTEIGCGLAGFSPKQIAPFFTNAPDNCILPISFKKYVEDV